MWLCLQGDRVALWPFSSQSERSLWWTMPGGKFGDQSPPVGSRPPALQQATSIETPPEPQEPPQRIPASPYSGCFLDKAWPGRLLGRGAPSFSQTSTHLPADIKPALCVSASLLGPPPLALTEQGCVPFLSSLRAQMGGAAGAAAPAEAPSPVARHGAGAHPPSRTCLSGWLTNPRGSVVTETMSSWLPPAEELHAAEAACQFLEPGSDFLGTLGSAKPDTWLLFTTLLTAWRAGSLGPTSLPGRSIRRCSSFESHPLPCPALQALFTLKEIVFFAPSPLQSKKTCRIREWSLGGRLRPPTMARVTPSQLVSMP